MTEKPEQPVTCPVCGKELPSAKCPVLTFLRGKAAAMVLEEMSMCTGRAKMTKAKPVYKWTLIPQYPIHGYTQEWIEVVVLVTTRTWAMCRRRDSPGAMPFVRPKKELRDEKPKEQT